METILFSAATGMEMQKGDVMNESWGQTTKGGSHRKIFWLRVCSILSPAFPGFRKVKVSVDQIPLLLTTHLMSVSPTYCPWISILLSLHASLGLPLPLRPQLLPVGDSPILISSRDLSLRRLSQYRTDHWTCQPGSLHKYLKTTV